MSLFNQRDQYGWLAILLHWLLFLLVLGLVASGKYSHSLPDGEKNFQVIGMHKQVGVAVLFLMTFRLLWRIINIGVAPAHSGGALVRLGAFVTHWLLYAAVIGQALVGVLMSQASGRDVTFLGVIKLPHFLSGVGADASPLMLMLTDAGVLREWHHYGAAIIGVLVALHFIGAMVHHFAWSDDTLRRMWFTYIPPYKKKTKAEQNMS